MLLRFFSIICFFALSGVLCLSAEEKPKSRVALLEDASLVSKFQIDGNRSARAFNRALMVFTGEKTVKDAWQVLLGPVGLGDTVVVKISAPGHPALATPKPIFYAVVDGLKSAGVSNIVAWDKFADRMIASGYPPGRGGKGWRLASVVPGMGFDGTMFYFNEVVGRLIWGDFEFRGKAEPLLEEPKDDEEPAVIEQISNRSYFTRLVTQKGVKIVNLAMMSDHPYYGVYGASASLAMASVDNDRRFQVLNGKPAIAEILNHEALKGKVVLHAILGLLSQFAGGPDFQPHYTRSPGMMMLSQDPVALDALALESIKRWREEAKVPGIGRSADWLEEAERLGVGVAERGQIQVVPVVLK